MVSRSLLAGTHVNEHQVASAPGELPRLGQGSAGQVALLRLAVAQALILAWPGPADT